MKFGFFDDVNREYAITTPQTPYPWINYLGSEKFFSLISFSHSKTTNMKEMKIKNLNEIISFHSHLQMIQ